MAKSKDGWVEREFYQMFSLALLEVYHKHMCEDVNGFYDAEYHLLDLCCQYIIHWDYIPPELRKEVVRCGSLG